MTRPSLVPALRDHAVYLAIVLLYCLPFIGDRDLFYRDEARYGGVLAEMLKTDSWFTLTISGEPYLDKPPLFFTLLRLFAEAAGTSAPFVFNGVVALTAWLYVGASDAFLRLAGFDRRTARQACLLLLAVPWIAVHMQVVRMDLLFSALILLSTGFYVRGLARDHANAWPLAAGALAGVAVLVKGPFGAAMPIVTVVAVALLSGTGRRLWRRDLLASLALALLIVAAWLLLLYVASGGAVVARLFGEQVVERALESRDSHRAWWLYLAWVPATMMPWLLLAPLLFVKRVRVAVLGADPSVPRLALRIAGAQFAVCFVLLNLVAQKNIPYLLPLVPALMVPLALACRRIDEVLPRAVDWLFIATAAAFPAFAIALPFALDLVPEAARADLFSYVGPASLFRAAGLVTLAGIPLAIGAALRGEARLYAAIGAVAVALAVVKATVLPDLAQVYSPRNVAAAFLPRVPAGTPIVVFGVYRGALSYHFDRPLTYVATAGELARKVGKAGPAYVIATERSLARRPAALAGFVPLDEHRLESTMLVLLKRD